MIKRLLLATFFIPILVLGQSGTTQPSAVLDPENLILEFYNSLSGPPGVRNWDAFRNLFVENAQVNAVLYNAEGEANPIYGTVNDYIEKAGKFFEQHRYEQREIKHHVDYYGNLAQVFSTYQTQYYLGNDAPPIEEFGLSSFQLVYLKDRWWIANVLWNSEAPGDPIPSRYLGQLPDVESIDETVPEVDLQKVYTTQEVEVLPNYPGESSALQDYLWTALDRSKAGTPLAIATGVKVLFTVMNDGEITDVSAEGSDEAWNKEVIRVFKSMPVWEPAVLGVESVRVKMEMTVKPVTP